MFEIKKGLIRHVLSNAERSEMLLKVIERIYEQNKNMQSTIDSMLVDLCREYLSRKGIFWFLLFYHNGI